MKKHKNKTKTSAQILKNNSADKQKKQDGQKKISNNKVNHKNSKSLNEGEKKNMDLIQIVEKWEAKSIH